LESERIIPNNVLEYAAETGADTLVAICRLGLGEKGVYCGSPVSFAGGFEFKRALDGLVAARKTGRRGVGGVSP
jgi:hypothetical protein